MSELSIVLSGVIEKSNFDEWKKELIEQIRSVKTELKTDDDFAAATKHVKQFKAAENNLKKAKQSALEQAAEINALFEAIDTVSEEARQARLTLDRQIKKRKEEIKEEFVAEGVAKVKAFIAEQSDAYQLIDHSLYTDPDIFEDALSGKASTNGMSNAIAKTSASIKESITLQAKVVDANLITLDNLPPNHQALFQDRKQLLALSGEQLNLKIDERVAKLEEQTANAAQPVADAQEVKPEAEAESEKTATTANADASDYTVTVEITGTEEEADAIRTAVVEALSKNAAVGNITLSAN